MLQLDVKINVLSCCYCAYYVRGNMQPAAFYSVRNVADSF